MASSFSFACTHAMSIVALKGVPVTGLRGSYVYIPRLPACHFLRLLSNTPKIAFATSDMYASGYEWPFL
jgi:hypothetical protein